MKILYLYNKGLMTPDLAISLVLMGHEVDTIDNYECSYILDDKECRKYIEEKIKDAQRSTNGVDAPYDYVMSFNFIPSASQICMRYNIPYIAWMYDAWQPSLYSEYGKLPCNRIFVFDRTEYSYLKSIGVNHVYYMPLAVNADRLGSLEISSEDEKKYQCDISMVGRLYCTEGVNGYSQMREYIDPVLKNHIDTIINETAGFWDEDNEWFNKFADIDYTKIPTVNAADNRDKYFLEDKIYYMAICFARAITQKDRTIALNALGEKFHTCIYTYEQTSDLTPSVEVRSGVDYMEQMPKVFNCSKINLNITLRSILSGIPLRAFDVLGSGGFLMTNHQKDMDLFFKEDIDYVSFSSIKELVEKAEYYLAHEDERMRIQINGYQKVNTYHTYQDRIEKMFKIMEMKTARI